MRSGVEYSWISPNLLASRPKLLEMRYCTYCQHHAANVMLKSILCIGKHASYDFLPLGRRSLRSQASRALISTNTAINTSLRRSQYKDIRTRRQSFERPRGDERNLVKRPYTDEWTRRPNHQQGQDVQDIERHTRINERYKALRQARTIKKAPREIKTFAHESVAKGLSTDETLREAHYDYTRKAGGNREARRAAQFGRKLEPPDEEALYTTTNRLPFRRRELRREREFNPPGRGALKTSTVQDEIDEGNPGLSIPEDLRDENSPRSVGRSPTMGRQAPDNMGFSGSRGSRGYGRDISQTNDQMARYHELDTPLSMPYTTPASEFLYGTSVVIAALLSSRRKLYKLYIYDGDNRDVRNQDTRVRKMALERNVVVQKVRGDWLRIMDKMSAGRPHNVCIQSLPDV
jgi:hypothetical protein